MSETKKTRREEVYEKAQELAAEFPVTGELTLAACAAIDGEDSSLKRIYVELFDTMTVAREMGVPAAMLESSLKENRKHFTELSHDKLVLIALSQQIELANMKSTIQSSLLKLARATGATTRVEYHDENKGAVASPETH